MTSMMLPILFLVLFLAITFISPISAVAKSKNTAPITHNSAPETQSNVLNTLKKKVTSKSWKEAYQYGLLHRDKEEGNPTFDFYFGLAALESGYPQQAQFAFERLIIEYPENSRFRLEYARSLFLSHNNKDAQREFKHVLATHPPVNVVKNIQGFLAAIKVRTEQTKGAFSGQISLGEGYDGNINNATDAQWIGIFQLPPSARRSASFYNNLGLSGIYQAPVNQHTQWAVHFSSRHKYNYNISTYNLDTFNLDITGSHQWQKVAMELQYGYSHTLLDGSDYQRVQKIGSNFIALVRPDFSVNGGVSAGIQDSFYSSLLDTYRLTGNLGARYLTSMGSQQLGIIAGSENTRHPGARYNGKNIRGITYQFNLANTYFGEPWSPYLAMSEFWSKYKAVQPFFGKYRKDHSWRVLLGLNYRIKKRWQAIGELSQVKNNSTLEIYNYRRTLFETRLEYTF